MKPSKDHLISIIPLLILSVSSFFIRLSHIPIRIWDEARNASNAVHMMQQGNWLVPYYQNAPDMWNTKPPLLIWIQVIFLKLFGINEFAIRLPSAIAASITVFVLWNFARKYFRDQWAGFFCAAVLVTSMGYVQNHSGRTGDYDALLVMFITLYCTSFFSWIREGKKPFYIKFWIFLSLAVLTKGIVGVMLLPGLFLFAVVSKKFFVLLKNKITWLGLASFLLVTGGYYLGREIINPGYLNAVYKNELGGRYLETLEQHQHPFNYYWERMKENSFIYWFFWIFPAFIMPVFRREKEVLAFTCFNLLMVLPFFLVISTGGTKLEWYALPVFPFLALQIGWFIYFVFGKILNACKDRQVKFFAGLVFTILILIFPLYSTWNYIHDFQEKPWDIEPHQPAWFLKNAAGKNIDLNNMTIIYEGYNGQIQFYLALLAAKDQTIQLKQNIDGLEPGDRILINQEKIGNDLRNKYGLKILEENSGCTMYLVLSRYE